MSEFEFEKNNDINENTQPDERAAEVPKGATESAAPVSEAQHTYEAPPRPQPAFNYGDMPKHSSIEYVPQSQSRASTPKKNTGMKVMVGALTVALVFMSLVCGILVGRLSSDGNVDEIGGDVVDTSPSDVDSFGEVVINYAPSPTIVVGEGSVADVAAKVADAVVEIRTETVQSNVFYGSYTVSGAGSGVIISPDGLIVTNHHVLDGASAIKVYTRDGREYVAKKLAQDYQSDLALVKIEGTGFTYATFGDSSALVVGQDVVAIGNPLGELGGTVTNGIISALERTISVGGVEMTLLQTNAAINPGNSGGGLFDMNGNLIGVVNAKYSESGIEGLGFAIPSNYALEIIEQFVENGGYVKGRPYLGISFTQGLYIKSYEFSHELAEGEEILQGDYLYAIDGLQVSDVDDVRAYLTTRKVGDTIQLTLARAERNSTSWFGGTTYRYYTVNVIVHESVEENFVDIEFEIEQ